MKQKNIWMLYLSIGLISSFMLSCKREVLIEYIINADIIYKNETPYTINYFQLSPNEDQKVFVFELLPNSEITKIVRGDGANKEIPDIDTYKGIFEDFQGDVAILIEYDNTKCLIYKEGEGTTTGNLSSGYLSQKISDRHYKFTYTFTEAEYLQAQECE